MEELLVKYFTEDINKQEKKLLFEAMDNDDALRKEFYDLQNTMAMAEFVDSNDRTLNRQAYAHFLRIIFRRRLFHQVLKCCKYAALIVAVSLCVYFVTYYRMNEILCKQYTEVIAPSGQRVKVNLPDGTVAWLSPCSTLRYAASFNSENRDVQLKGSTFFEVSHNEKMPFRISTGIYNITVLGTRFNVMAYPESKRFEINLIEGSVQIDNTNDSTDRLVLLPHERAVLQNCRLYKQTSDFDNEEYLKNGIVSFNSRPFGEILENVALWQGVILTVDKSVDTNRLVTGKFRQSDSLESILHVLQTVADFRYTIVTEKNVIIYR